MTPLMIQQAKTYAEQMLALKQIRALPDFATFFDHALLRPGRRRRVSASVERAAAAPRGPAVPALRPRRLLGVVVPGRAAGRLVAGHARTRPTA